MLLQRGEAPGHQHIGYKAFFKSQMGSTSILDTVQFSAWDC